MNFSLSNKKSFKRIPLRTVVPNIRTHSSTSRESLSSLYAVIGNKPVSLQEYNKVMIQNQRLAKENASLKSRLNEYKSLLLEASNEKLDLKQQLSAANTLIQKLKTELKNKKISDKIKSAVSLLKEHYMAIHSIKSQINEYEGRVESFRTIMSSLEPLIECKDELNGSNSSEDSTDRSSNSSMRRLSSQEIDIKRRLSSEKIQRDFEILSDLSTIMEMSSEHRNSSLSDNVFSDGIDVTNSENPNVNESESIGALELPTNGKPILVFNNTNSSVSEVTTNGINTANPMTSNATKNSDKSKAIKIKAKKENKTTKTTKTSTKKTTKKQTKTKIKANDSIVSIYDFDDDEGNKENVIPLIPPQRHSKRIRSKRYSLSS